jgi:hypothetical protein
MKTIAVLGLMFVLLCSGFTGLAGADGSIDITGAVQWRDDRRLYRNTPERNRLFYRRWELTDDS